MSFDLHFYSNDLGKIIEKSAFNEYFSERTHYELNGNQAFYSNETTGVYFYFEYSDSKGLDEEWDQFAEYNKILPVQFNLNMYRPHVFGLEAAGELSAFISNFNLGVYDPQEERKFDVYSQETFIQNWNKSNEFGYQAMLNQIDTEKNIYTMPTDQIEKIWKWNVQREELYCFRLKMPVFSIDKSLCRKRLNVALPGAFYPTGYK